MDLLDLEGRFGDRLAGAVVYGDPPYVGTKGYAQGGFDYAKAWETYRALAQLGAHVYVSEFHGPDDYLVAKFERKPALR